jgi:hypothetical protein
MTVKTSTGTYKSVNLGRRMRGFFDDTFTEGYNPPVSPRDTPVALAMRGQATGPVAIAGPITPEGEPCAKA